MEDEKRARAGDGDSAGSPRKGKAPRIEPDAADDSGWGGDASSPEVSDPADREPAVAIRGTDGEHCKHIAYGINMDDIAGIVSKFASGGAPECNDETCQTARRDLMMVCSECDLYFCIGYRPDNRTKPKGHVWEHAYLEGHWVALWYEDPFVGYCFECEDSLAIVSEEKGEKGPMVNHEEGSRASGIGCSGTVLSSEVSGPRDRVPAVAIRDTDGKQCRHTACDINMHYISGIVSKIASGGEPLCKDDTCRTTRRHLMMVCTECDLYLCVGRKSGNRAKPRGHMQEHALLEGHWVALWYEDPYTGYCFDCEDSLTIVGAEKVEKGTVVNREEGSRASGFANRQGCVIRGIPNQGNTCYLNALLQCLLVLEKLRAVMSRPDAPSGPLGGVLRDLFDDTSSVSYTRRILDPMDLLACARMLNPRFEGNLMQDSHELLCYLRDGLNREETDVRPGHMQQGAPTDVAPTVINSIFGGQFSETKFCKCCSFKSVTYALFHDLSVPIPPKGTPAESVASPPQNERRMPQQKIHIKPFPAVDKANTEKIHTLAKFGDPQVSASDSEDIVMVKTSEPLKVDSNTLKQIGQCKDVVHCPLQTPMRKENVLISSGSDVERTNNAVLDNAVLDSIRSEDSTEAKMDTFSAEVTTEDKEKGQNHDIVHDEAEEINSLASIEACLELHFKAEMVELKCENCSKVAQKESTVSGKDGQQTMACTNVNRTIDGDQAQEDVPSCCQADKQANLLSGQGQNTSTQDQGREEQVNLGHNAHAVEENQYDRHAKSEVAIKKCLISKLPAVLVIHLQRNLNLHKVIGHVSFKEILDMALFLDPSSEDKDNSRYRLVGVVEHEGPGSNEGHFLAYVRPSPHQQADGSSSWFRASDCEIREISLEEVLKCEAYILFYERMGG